MIGREERVRLGLEEMVSVIERSEVHYEHGVVISQTREEFARQLERGHAIARAFFHSGQSE